MKKIVLSDRGCLFVDMILQETDWEIQLLIIDDFGHHKEKYAGNSRIKVILTFTEMCEWSGDFELDKTDVEGYLKYFNVGDYGSRRLMDDFFYSHYQFYQGIAFWNNYFNNNEIDLCIITNTLHGFVNDYLLEEVCKKKNIQCYNVFYHFLYKYGLFDVNKDELVKIRELSAQSINLDDIANYRSKFDYNEIKDIPYGALAKIVYKFFGAQGVRYVAFLIRGRIQNIHYRKTSVLDYYRAVRHIKKLQKFVKKLYTPVDYKNNYLVYFLHFEPEAVVSGNSQYIDSQIAQIQMLASKLPDDWVLYVKEHPDLYENISSWNMEYHIPVMPTFYTEYFYKKITSLKNVYLVDYHNPASELIKRCKGMATIAGTVMTEAITLKKPILMFADKRHVYQYSRDIVHITSSADIVKGIEQIKSGVVPDYNDIDELCDLYLADVNDFGMKEIIDYIGK